MYVVEDKNDSLKINSSDTLLRVSPIFSAVIQMQVATKLGGTPAMDRYCCVRYISGRSIKVMYTGWEIEELKIGGHRHKWNLDLEVPQIWYSY